MQSMQAMQGSDFQARFLAAARWLGEWPWQTEGADRAHALDICLAWSKQQLAAGLDPRECDQTGLVKCLYSAFEDIHGQEPARHLTVIFMAVFSYWVRTSEALREIRENID